MFEQWRPAAAALILALACGDEAPQPSFEGTYLLTELNGSALPYDHEGLGCCTYLAGRLEISDGRYMVAVTARNRNTGVLFTASEEGTYTQHADDTMTFVRETFVVQPFLLSSATVTGTVITLSFGGEGPGAPDQFHAVFQLD